MIDLHCHILNGVDDGSSSMEQSVDMAMQAVDDGITDIVATPHFIEGRENYDAAELRKRHDAFRVELEEKGIALNVHLGNEIYISRNTRRLVESKEAFTLAESRYVLIELPFFELPDFIENAVYDLRLSGYVPVIAHPERNRLICRHPNRLLDFLQIGALAQVNADSLLGRNGRTVKRAVETMLAHNMAHFVASDAHNISERRPCLMKARKEATKLLGHQAARNLFETNPGRVLKNEEISKSPPVRIKEKKSIFKLF